MKKIVVMILLLVAQAGWGSTTTPECPDCICPKCPNCTCSPGYTQCPAPVCPTPVCPDPVCPAPVCPELVCNCPDIPDCPDCNCPDPCPDPCDDEIDYSGSYNMIGAGNANGWNTPEIILGTMTIFSKGDFGWGYQCMIAGDITRRGCMTYFLQKR